MANPNINQHSFAFYQDDNADPDQCTIVGSVDSTSETYAMDTNLMVRLGLENNDADADSDVFRLLYQVNGTGGAWNPVTTSSSNVKIVTGTPTDGASCNEQQLGDGPGGGSWDVIGLYDDGDGVTGTIAWDKDEFFECQWCVQLLSADLSVNDVVHFWVDDNGNGTTDFTSGADAQITAVTGGSVTVKLDLGADDYQHTGGIAALKAVIKRALEADDYQHTGGDLSFAVTRLAALAETSYQHTGGDLTFKSLRSMILNGVVWSTGVWANGVWDTGVWIAGGGYASHGGDLDFQVNRLLTLAETAYQHTGGDLSFVQILKLSLEAGSYQHTGGDLTFVEQISGAVEDTLVLDADFYTSHGGALTLKAILKSVLASDFYDSHGGDVTFRQILKATLEETSFQHTGADSTFRITSPRTLEGTHYDHSGSDLSFTLEGKIALGQAAFGHTGGDMAFKVISASAPTSSVDRTINLWGRLVKIFSKRRDDTPSDDWRFRANDELVNQVRTRRHI